MPVPDLKVVLLGDNAVGKTCLSYRFANDRFIAPSALNSTIGAAYFSKQMSLGNKKITLGIWDTAGSERYEALTKVYYRGANAAIICYDVSRPKTFDKVKFWVNELRTVEESCKIYICATKKDLLDYTHYTAEHLKKVESYADSLPAKFYITSSKTGENIADVFQDITIDCEPMIKKRENGRSTGDESIRLSPGSKRMTCCSFGRNN